MLEVGFISNCGEIEKYCINPGKAMPIKKSRTTRFEKEGYLIRLGSSLLHFGVVILIFNFVNLQDNPYHLLIFWLGVILITSGNICAFYPEKISSLFSPGQILQN